MCETTLLPLRHGPAAAFDRILGTIAPLERPYWLGSEPVTHQTVASLRLIWPDEAPSFLRRRSDRPDSTAIPTATVTVLPTAQTRRRDNNGVDFPIFQFP
jgi:hypothetical protein